MKKLLPILCTLLLVGCSSITPKKEYSFASGMYLLELSWENRENYSFEALIDNKSGDLEFISPYNGEVVMSGLIEDNKFLASIYQRVTYVAYRGILTADNHIEGKISGRVLADPNRAYPSNFKKPATILNDGKFKIVPYKPKSSKAIFDFLPSINASNFFIPRVYDPRTYAFILMPKLKLFDFREMIYRPSGMTISSFKKQPITLEQLKENIKAVTNKFGNDIPIEIYADKNVSISSLSRILEICQKAEVYRFALKALQPKWDGLYRIPIDTPPEKTVPDELELKITKHSCLINGKTKKDINNFLIQIEDKKPDQIIAINYSDDATIQELLSILVLCRKNKLTRVYLKNKDKTYNKSVSP
jgi:biopolymer transport protein ExbD